MTAFQQCILKGALGIEHLAVGLTVYEENDHTLALTDGMWIIARFSATGATMQEIRKAADRYLKEYGTATDTL